jgi:hypothetical protein
MKFTERLRESAAKGWGLTDECIVEIADKIDRLEAEIAQLRRDLAICRRNRGD